MENIEALLNELEDEILKGRKTLIGNNIVVNAQACNELLLRIRESLPESIARSQVIINDCDKYIRDAQLKANEIIANARLSADNLIKNSEITRAASEQAEVIRNQAMQQKEKADYAARKRVDELLESTEQSIEEALLIIRNERDAIWQGIKHKRGD